MSSPKIGRTVTTDRNPLIAAANQLAYTSRKLREAADEHAAQEAVLNRLRDIGNAEARAEAERSAQARATSMAAVQPLLKQAREMITADAAAVAEVQPLIDSFSGVNWAAVGRRYPGGHGVTPGSEESTQTRLGFLRRTVEEAREILQGNTSAAASWLRQVETTDPASREGVYAANGLRGSLPDRSVTLRAKAAAIRKLLAVLGPDILAEAPSAPADVEVC
jgi:hypothetical protein